jgi:hypothetical protein
MSARVRPWACFRRCSFRGWYISPDCMKVLFEYLDAGTLRSTRGQPSLYVLPVEVATRRRWASEGIHRSRLGNPVQIEPPEKNVST